MRLRPLLQEYGKRYPDALGIGLTTERGLFKWFIASILLGARISETLALRTYRQLESDNLLSFNRMSEASWDDLVASLDAGGYVRYDFSTASNLQAICKKLKEEYNGKLSILHQTAQDSKTLNTRLQDFPGIGPVTANIFLRDMRTIWPKADPPLGHLAAKAARELGIRNAKECWKKNKVRGYSFSNFETALMRIGREARRRKISSKTLLRRKGLLILSKRT